MPETDDHVCPQCSAEYKIVRISADPGAADATVQCIHCQAEFPGRDDDLILKYQLSSQNPL